MIPRILEKDIRVALQKLEKLPLDHIRNLTKDIGNTKESGSDNTNGERCEQILAKLFTVQDTCPAVYATSAKNEEEKLEQKLETIDERPLVEAESGNQGVDFPPKVLGQSVPRPSDIQWKPMNIEDAALDEIARKLMSSPPREIDRRLLEAYTITTIDTNQIKKGELEFISSNNRPVEVSRSNDAELFDDIIDGTFPSSSHEYSVDIIDETTNHVLEVERPQPIHYDAEYATYIEKGTLRHKMLQELEELGVALVPQNELMLVPLPPNQTAISSCNDATPNLQIKEMDDNIDSTSISSHTLRRNITQSSRTGRNEMAEFVTYFSTPSYRAPTCKTAQMAKKDDLDSVPLSVLLKWARQRSMAEKETRKDRTWKGERYFSKDTCLPPLDFRPRARTCPPRPCPPRKTKKEMPCPPPKDPCPPPKKITCPPPKKITCPPPKKIPCPQPRMPCPEPKRAPCPPPKDPCPKSPCDPCKPPPGCPPKEKPCSLIIGNRIKETISLILSAYEPLSPLRLLSSRKGKCSMSTVALCPTLLSENPLIGLRRLDDNVYSGCSSLPAEVEGFESVALSRGFDPWTPIPSWPITKRKAQKRLICPKEGCPPPKPPKNPCKEQPCDTAKHRKFTADSNLYC